MLSIKTSDNFQEMIKKEQEIFAHPAWHGEMIGLDCENLLRGKPTFSYLLRSGEVRFHYYLSYVVESPFQYKHQPFMVSLEESRLGWGYRNLHNWWASKLEDLIPLILHQPKEQCLPILKTNT